MIIVGLAFPPRLFVCRGSLHKRHGDYPWLCYCSVIIVVLLRSDEGALVVGRTRFHCTKRSKLHSGESLFAILGFSVLRSLISHFFHYSSDERLGLVFCKSLPRPTKVQPVSHSYNEGSIKFQNNHTSQKKEAKTLELAVLNIRDETEVMRKQRYLN